MFLWIVLIVTFLGSIMVAHMFGKRQKALILPVCAGYTFALVATVGSVGGFLHFIFTVWNYVMVMFLCNGFPRRDGLGNPVWKAFLVFYGYMFLVVFTGYFPLEGAREYLQIFLNTFAAGYFLAMWMCKNEGAYGKVLTGVLVAAWFTIIYVVRHGGLDASGLDANGRGALDVNLLAEGVRMNVNHSALAYSCFLPFLVSAMLLTVRKPSDSILRFLSGIAFILISIMIVRTGSRNGALALLPCLWFFFCATKRRHRAGRILIGILVVGALLVGVARAMRNAESIRAFDFRAKSQLEKGYETAGDAATSGRLELYLGVYNQMTFFEKIFGKGFTLNGSRWTHDRMTGTDVYRTKITMENLHSIWVSIFCRAGFLGVLLFIIFIVISFRRGFMLGDRGRLALLYFGVWLLTGTGEAWGVIGGQTAILAGIAMGLLTNQTVTNSELMIERDRLMMMCWRG